MLMIEEYNFFFEYLFDKYVWIRVCSVTEQRYHNQQVILVSTIKYTIINSTTVVKKRQTFAINHAYYTHHLSMFIMKFLPKINYTDISYTQKSGKKNVQHVTCQYENIFLT